jgi:hypothetical protein
VHWVSTYPCRYPHNVWLLQLHGHRLFLRSRCVFRVSSFFCLFSSPPFLSFHAPRHVSHCHCHFRSTRITALYRQSIGLTKGSDLLPFHFVCPFNPSFIINLGLPFLILSEKISRFAFNPRMSCLNVSVC